MDNQDLKKAGLKVTLPRIKILQLLNSQEDRHLSAEDIYRLLVESGDDVGVATVYRVLTQFEKAGLVTRHNFEGGHSVFEINHGEHHDHMVCIKCGAVTEFVDEHIEQRQQVIADKHQFSMTDHSLTIYGVCRRCK